MKKVYFYLLTCLIASVFIISCEPEEDPSFDETLLEGKWQSGTVFYRYNMDGTGVTWDTSDDVTEEEGQKFTWTLVKDEFTHIHIMEIGGNVPKYYTLTQLTATTLKYHDDYSHNFSFTKVGS